MPRPLVIVGATSGMQARNVRWGGVLSSRTTRREVSHDG
jgi:hypothetical protein